LGSVLSPSGHVIDLLVTILDPSGHLIDTRWSGRHNTNKLHS